MRFLAIESRGRYRVESFSKPEDLLDVLDGAGALAGLERRAKPFRLKVDFSETPGSAPCQQCRAFNVERASKEAGRHRAHEVSAVKLSDSRRCAGVDLVVGVGVGDGDREDLIIGQAVGLGE